MSDLWIALWSACGLTGATLVAILMHDSSPGVVTVSFIKGVSKGIRDSKGNTSEERG